MCNRNWIMVALALCVLGGLLYYVKQSDGMKKEVMSEAQSHSHVKTAMDTEGAPEWTEEEGMEVSEEEGPYAEMMEEEEITEPMQ